MSERIFILALIIAALAGCDRHLAAPLPTPTPAISTLSAPPAPSPANPLQSKLLSDLTMPVGSELISSKPGYEDWSIPGDLTSAEQTMRGLLPVGHNLQSLRWCKEDPPDNGGGPTWYWRRFDGGSITVDINPNDDTHSEAVINAGDTDLSMAADGCSGY
jgi:hypothetical protein